MLRRRMMFMIVSSSMLADRSTRISVRLPPSFSPVRYCRSPSPLNSRILLPSACSSSARASSRLTSSSSVLISDCSASMLLISASVSSSYFDNSMRNCSINSMICAICPSAVTFSVSNCSIVFFARTRFFRPSRISSSIFFVSPIRSDGSFSVVSLT